MSTLDNGLGHYNQKFIEFETPKNKGLCKTIYLKQFAYSSSDDHYVISQSKITILSDNATFFYTPFIYGSSSSSTALNALWLGIMCKGRNVVKTVEERKWISAYGSSETVYSQTINRDESLFNYFNINGTMYYYLESASANTSVDTKLNEYRDSVKYMGESGVKCSLGTYLTYDIVKQTDTPVRKEFSSQAPFIFLLGNSSDRNKAITNVIDNGGTWVNDNDAEQFKNDTKTNWKLYIDGTKLPNYKLLWNNDKASENAVIHVFGAKEKILDKLSPDLPANDEIQFSLHDNCKLTYKDFNSLCGNLSYDEGIGALLPKNGGWLGMYMTDGSKKSEQIAVNLYPKEVTDEEIHGSAHPTHLYGAIWSEGEDGSTLTIIENGKTWDGKEDETSDEDDKYENFKDEEDDNIEDSTNNSIGVLTSTYKMSRERLSQLGAFLWSGNIFDSFSLVNSNPIENIVSCKDIPFSIGSGTDSVITLGNVNTGVNGEKVNTNFSEVTIGSITIPKKYNNFLDLAPYTKVTIYLPYIGFKEIDVTQIMGKTITVKYAVDVITGGCIAEIFCSNTRLYEFSGQMGVDIPITASNRAQIEAGYISNVVSGGADLLTGDVVGASESMLSSAFSKYHYSSTSAPSPSCVGSLNRTCYVVIDRPTYDNLKVFNHTRGRMCNLSKKIGNLKGYTICDSHVDLSGIVATDEEKTELIKILSSGFFA